VVRLFPAVAEQWWQVVEMTVGRLSPSSGGEDVDRPAILDRLFGLPFFLDFLLFVFGFFYVLGKLQI
jgi:hypothetical protein